MNSLQRMNCISLARFASKGTPCTSPLAGDIVACRPDPKGRSGNEAAADATRSRSSARTRYQNPRGASDLVSSSGSTTVSTNPRQLRQVHPGYQGMLLRAALQRCDDDIPPIQGPPQRQRPDTDGLCKVHTIRSIRSGIRTEEQRPCHGRTLLGAGQFLPEAPGKGIPQRSLHPTGG